ncbi:MAG: c-type cytochrome [Actinomycetota bacterium]|jgi:ubiquinol-cytochrome c reductase cytochrome c subunit
MSQFPLRLRSAVLTGLLILTSSLLFFAAGAHADVPLSSPFQTSRANSGTPKSDHVSTDKSGQVTSYGNSAITYNLPPAALQNLGRALYMQNCASCHGIEANGVPPTGTSGTSSNFPNLLGVGPAAIDFWIESGRMPAAEPRDVQSKRKRARFDHTQAMAIASWVNSLHPGLPLVPTVNTTGADVANGASLFALNCAACHTITGGGDALAAHTYAPSLRNIPGYQVAEAIRTGPGNMPRFTGNLTDAQVRDIVTYVTVNIQHPVNTGGLGLGGLGPVAEGFVGLALGVGFLALAGFWVGERND